MNKYAGMKPMGSKKPRPFLAGVPIHPGHPNRSYTQPTDPMEPGQFTAGLMRRSPPARALMAKIAAIKSRRKGGGDYGINRLKAELHALAGRRK